MKKAIFSVIMIAALAGVGWRYASPRTREALLGFIGMASRRARGEDVPAAELRRAVENAVLPADPAERRKALTEELRRNIGELRRLAVTDTNDTEATGGVELLSNGARASTTATDVLTDTERIVKELEGANQDASPGTKIVERILERLLPESVCKQE